MPAAAARCFTRARLTLLTLAGTVCAVLAWVYWSAWEEMVGRWLRDPQYSHGFLIPVFAAVVLWFRRGDLPERFLAPSWWGVPWVLAAAAVRLAGAFFYFPWLDGWSLVPGLVGVTLLVGGWPALRWAWPAVVLFLFMLPMPYQVELALTHPLQGLATQASVYALQMLGYPALAEGNVIVLGELRIGVLEACSGLGMLFTFFALATAVAFFMHRPLGDRLFIFLSAVPVAVLMNVARCTVTAILHVMAGSAVANAVFHDLAGWLMMPLALGVLWLELKLLTRLFVEEPPSRPIPLRLPRALPDAPATSRAKPAMPREETTKSKAVVSV
jgi:exosortase